jgi:hypothetical protein
MAILTTKRGVLMMKRLLAMALSVAILSACTVEENTATPVASQGGTTPSADGSETLVNIGDVEQQIWTALTLSTVGHNAELTVIDQDLLQDARKHVNFVKLTIGSPYPDDLYLDYMVKSVRAFPRTPVVARGTFVLEAEYDDGREPYRAEYPLFKAMFGRDGARATHEGQVDILHEVPGKPSTMLLRIRTEALLLPEDTDEETVDVDTATAPVGRSATLSSNPVRIDFVNSND